MFFYERHSQLLPFCEYVFGSGMSPFEVQPEILDISLLRKVYVVPLFMWTGGEVSLPTVKVIWTDLDSLTFILQLL
jgi:hypothetical protein